MAGTGVETQDELSPLQRRLRDVLGPKKQAKSTVERLPAPKGNHPNYRATAVVALLWLIAGGVTVVLFQQRYRGAVSGGVGSDFQIYLHAARLVAAGHNPYRGDGQFIYPPTLALFLAPFVHAAPIHVFQAWTLFELAALVAGVAVFVVMQAPKLAPWSRPLLFAFCIITAFHFWPLTLGLFLGQADTFVFAAVMLSAWAATRHLSATRGVLIAVAGLLKTWPAAIVLAVFQRGSGHRFRAVAGFVVAIMMAPALALAFGGKTGLVDFVRSVISARNQHLVSDSVWGAPSLLFSHSGLARPLAASATLQGLSTGILLIWVVGLLVVALRTPGDGAMCTWNVMFCTVLLLPVSHLAYSLYCLPVLWLWTSRILEDKRFTWQRFVVPAVLLGWWLIQTKSWPDSGSSAAIGSIHYVVVFAADLVACTASVIGARLIERPGLQSTELRVDLEPEDALSAGQVPTMA